jgi:hypothetical protein
VTCSDLTAIGRDQSTSLTVARTFVNEIGRQLATVHGSRRAKAVAEREEATVAARLALGAS